MGNSANGQNLNLSGIWSECRSGRERLRCNNVSSHDGQTSVYFRDLESALIDNIKSARHVVGCVAWLTSGPILRALAEVRGSVSIVVQKEDFLRPDGSNRAGWAAELQKLYRSIPAFGGRGDIGGLLASMNYLRDPSIDAVRCVGNHNRDRNPAFPRMHNKFLVFCVDRAEASEWDMREWHEDRQGSEQDDGCTHIPCRFRYASTNIIPVATWTGSFNLTKNATMSFENAVLLRDARACQAYFAEWEQIVALSEPLNWSSPWMEPEWRIGS